MQPGFGARDEHTGKEQITDHLEGATPLSDISLPPDPDRLGVTTESEHTHLMEEVVEVAHMLCDQLLCTLPEELEKPLYNREQLTTGVLHFGLGNFARAHLCTIMHDYLQQHPDDLGWGVAGVSLRSRGDIDALREQDGLFAVGEVGGADAAKQRVRVIGSIKDLAFAPEDPQKVIDLYTAPTTKIITLTVTQKGYPVKADDLSLVGDSPDVIHDLTLLEGRLLTNASFGELDSLGYSTAMGYLLEGIARRRELGLEQPVLLSLDNTPPHLNGEVLRSALVHMARAVDQDLGDYIEESVVIGHSMVDRITPDQNRVDKTLVSHKVPQDRASIVTEQYRELKVQMPIEDASKTFPWLNSVHGVHEVSNLEPYAALKSRVLNSTHVIVAQLATRMGIGTVDEFMRTPELASLVERGIVNELSPTVELPLEEREQFARGVMERFENDALKDPISRLNGRGSDKLPNRIGAVVQRGLDENRPMEVLSLTYGAWLHNVRGTDEKGGRVELDDPRHDIIERLRNAGTVDEMLAVEEVFPIALTSAPEFRIKVEGFYELLKQHSIRDIAVALVNPLERPEGYHADGENEIATRLFGGSL